MVVSLAESCIGYMYYATHVVVKVANELGRIRGGHIAVEHERC
jgi:hypothetical protein